MKNMGSLMFLIQTSLFFTTNSKNSRRSNLEVYIETSQSTAERRDEDGENRGGGQERGRESMERKGKREGARERERL